VISSGIGGHDPNAFPFSQDLSLLLQEQNVCQPRSETKTFNNLMRVTGKFFGTCNLALKNGRLFPSHYERTTGLVDGANDAMDPPLLIASTVTAVPRIQVSDPHKTSW